jgi:hypothetical protein
MFAFIEQRLVRYREARAERRTRQAARNEFVENARFARIRLCPGCQVPIEKNEGCDHMHCAVCGLHFSWRLAVPCNMDTLDNTGDGRFRYCPNCQYQNNKLHSLSEARCARCQHDFLWEEALFVPITRIRTPRITPQPQPQPAQREPTTRNRAGAMGGENDCGATRQAPPQTSAALRAWLNDPKRAHLAPSTDIPCGAGQDEQEGVIVEALRCEICTTRPKLYALQCGHMYCEQCLVTFLGNQPICPTDRAVVETAPIRIYF